MSLLSRLLQLLSTLVSRSTTFSIATTATLAAIRADQAAAQQAAQSSHDAQMGMLAKIIDLLEVGEAVYARFTVTLEGQTTIGVQMLQLTDSQQAALAVEFFDKKDRPTTVDGAPVWTSSDDTVATVTPGTLDETGAIVPDTTGVNAVVVAVGPGSAQITNTADADLSPNVRNVINTLDVTVSPGEAVRSNIKTAAPVEQP